MIQEINEKLKKYDRKILELFLNLRAIILEVEPLAEERIWASLPSYYKDQKFIRLIPFKEYINIEASSIKNYLDILTLYKITPKGMMSIKIGQEIPSDTLRKIFFETLNSKI